MKKLKLNLTDYLDAENEEARKVLNLINTYNYKYSQKIMSERLKKGLTRSQASDLINVATDKYILFEHASPRFEEDEYENTLLKLKALNIIELPETETDSSISLAKSKISLKMQVIKKITLPNIKSISDKENYYMNYKNQHENQREYMLVQ